MLTNGSIFIFGGILSLWVLRNLGTHFYNKRKHQKFLEFFNEKKYILIKNISTNIDVSKSKSPYHYQINKADVIFFREHIFLLITSKILKQAQPILQISRIGNTEKFADIWEEINYISKSKVSTINGLPLMSQRGSLKINYKIFLDFENKNFNFEQYLNESK